MLAILALTVVYKKFLLKHVDFAGYTQYAVQYGIV